MSDDKSMEGDFPEDALPDADAGVTASPEEFSRADLVEDDFPEDGFAEDGFADHDEVPVFEDTDGGFDEFAGDDGDDFVEEDWEAYDDGEAYLDDSDDGGALQARRAAFNKVLIGAGVVVLLVAGSMVMFKKEEENLGLPAVEGAKVADPLPVTPGQKVEFHEETKVSTKDSFGIKYGEATEIVDEEEKRAPVGGILNNPETLTEIRDAEIASGEFYIVEEGEDGFYEEEMPEQGPKLVDGTPPMPAPIAQIGEQIDDDFDFNEFSGDVLTPMPDPAVKTASVPRPPEDDMLSVGLPKADDIIRDGFGQDDQAVAETGDNDDLLADDGASGDRDVLESARGGQGGLAEMMDEGAAGNKDSDRPFYELTGGDDLGTDDALSAVMDRADVIAFDEEKEPVPPPPVVSSGASAAQTEKVMQKLDAVLTRMDEGFSQIEYLQDAVEGLESRIAKLETAPPPRTVVTPARAEPVKPVSARETIVPPVKTAAPPKPSVPVATSSPAPQPATQWVLKSAQPGQAFVARKGENDLVSITVGETLAGVGRITSIDVQNGRWVVQGTKSTIMQ